MNVPNRFSNKKPIQYGPKETFSWSYSKLRDYRSCPRKFNEVTLTKRFAEQKSDALERGDALHRAFARRVNQGQKMPTAFEHLNAWGDEAAKIIHPYQINVCEKEIAIDRKFNQTGYFDNNVWLRVKIDLIKLFPTKTGKYVALVVDYKTGKPSDDIIQLAVYSQCVFTAWPDVVGVRAEYWWEQIMDKSHEMFTREDMKELWAELLPELGKMEVAIANKDFPPKKNGLCAKHCPVFTCEFNQRRG